MWILTTGTKVILWRYCQFPVAERRAKGALSFQSVNIRSERKAPKEAGQASMRVRRRVMDLRAILDNGDAGNTCCIIKSPLFKGVQKDHYLFNP